MPIPVSLPPISAPDLPRPAQAPGGKGTFQSTLQDAIERVQTVQSDASKTVQKFVTGEAEELHSVALGVQRAELEFELFLQVRNKIVQAYQEIMRMQM